MSTSNLLTGKNMQVKNLVSVEWKVAISVALVVFISNAEARDRAIDSLFTTEQWQSEYPTALSYEDEEGLILSQARQRWRAMSDSERASLMAKQYKANARAGYYVAPPPEPPSEEKKVTDTATEKSKAGTKNAGDKKKQQKKKPKPAAPDQQKTVKAKTGGSETGDLK